MPSRRNTFATPPMPAVLGGTGVATLTGILAVTLAVTLAGPAAAAPAHAPTSSPVAPATHVASTTQNTPSHTIPARRRIELGGVTVRLRPGTRQVVTVNARAGWHARVVLWRKTEQHGWERKKDFFRRLFS